MRCNNDFQWVSKELNSKTAAINMDMEEQQPPQTKPPIYRSTRNKTPKREKSAPGSLDRRPCRTRQDREQKSRSMHVPKYPPKLDDYMYQNQNWCCYCHSPQSCFKSAHGRHDCADLQRYGGSCTLTEQRHGSESQQDIRSDCSKSRHDLAYADCCSYHPPPFCFLGDNRNYHWPKPYFPKVLYVKLLIYTITPWRVVFMI